jgi:hypothetical protein
MRATVLSRSVFARRSALIMPVTLVNDLVPIIVDLTYWTNTELIVLSLISPVWLQPVRRRLYRHPTITSVKQCRHLVRTLQSVEALQCLVKGINLWLHEDPFLPIDRLPIRFVLELEGLDCVSFLSSTATFLMLAITHPTPVQRIIILPSRRRLKIPASRPIIEWNPKLAEKFVSLKKLAISGVGLRITPSHATPYEFHLSHLVISQCIVIQGPLPQLLSPASWSHLRSLTIIADHRIAPEIYGMATILSYCGELLHSLRMEYRSNMNISANDFILIDGLFRDALEGDVILVSLRKLHLVDMIGQEACLAALQTIGQRCPHLEVLKVTGRSWPSLRLQELAWPVDISDARLIFPQLTLLEGPSKVFRLGGEDLALNSTPYDCDEEW